MLEIIMNSYIFIYIPKICSAIFHLSHLTSSTLFSTCDMMLNVEKL